MSLVVDASLALCWYFEDERTPAADALLDQVTENGTVVPSLWRLEIANGFLIAVRRRRIDTAFRDRVLIEFARLPISIDPETDSNAWKATLQLADRFQLSSYDASYLEPAVRLTLPLGTTDKALRSTAEASGVVALAGGQ